MRLLRNTCGASFLEYLSLGALVSIASLTAFFGLGDAVTGGLAAGDAPASRSGPHVDLSTPPADSAGGARGALGETAPDAEASGLDPSSDDAGSDTVESV